MRHALFQKLQLVQIPMSKLTKSLAWALMCPILFPSLTAQSKVDPSFDSKYCPPVAYWTMDVPNCPPCPKIGTHNLSASGAPLNFGPGLVGNALKVDASNKHIAVMPNFLDRSYAIEFVLQPGADLFQPGIARIFWSNQDLGVSISYSSNPTNGFVVPTLLFKTETEAGYLNQTVVPLDGIGPKSQYFHTSQDPKHFAFTYDANTGIQKIYINGSNWEEFSNINNNGSHGLHPPMPGNPKTSDWLQISHKDNYLDACIDEIAIYYGKIPPDHIWYQHYLEAMGGNHYDFADRGLQPPPPPPIDGPMDINQFAKGHQLGLPWEQQQYTETAPEQILRYPAPRHWPFSTLMWNQNWADPQYLGGRTQPGVSEAEWIQNSVDIQAELARTFRFALMVNYNISAWHNGNVAWTDLANQHPEWPAAVFMLYTSINPSVLGDPLCNVTKPLLTPSYVPLAGALTDLVGDCIDRATGLKPSICYWSPASDPQVFECDGRTQLYYLERVLNHLTRPLDLIAENWEMDTSVSEAAMNADPNVIADRGNLGAYEYRSIRLADYLEFYRDTAMNNPLLDNTYFSIYNFDGVGYDTMWREGRRTSTPVNGMHLATPYFYLFPGLWRDTIGALHSFEWLAAAKQVEIANGDPLNSPYVSPGYNRDPESNMVPGIFLGLLKAFSMTGVEFYYSAFFNLTPPPAPFAKPESYLGSLVLPSYAQAAMSHVEFSLRDGHLLPGDRSGLAYSSRGSHDQHLIVARKHNTQDKYTIAATIQPYSNLKGNVPENDETTILLDGDSLTFDIRVQGNVFVYDKTDPLNPVFYTVDAWHENAHPSNWSEDMKIDAEVYDLYDGITLPAPVIRTEAPGQPGDFRDFVSYVSFCNAGPSQPGNELDISLQRERSTGNQSQSTTGLHYSIQPRKPDPNGNNTSLPMAIWILARSCAGLPTGVTLNLDGAGPINCETFSNGTFQWVKLRNAIDNKPVVFQDMELAAHDLVINPTNNLLEIDKILLTYDLSRIPPTSK